MPAKSSTIRKTSGQQSGRSSVVKRTRMKLSTTVAAENFDFLQAMVSDGRTGSVAEAVDLAIGRLRRIENRERLESATAQYFENLSRDAQVEENDLARRLALSARGLDFDLEP